MPKDTLRYTIALTESAVRELNEPFWRSLIKGDKYLVCSKFEEQNHYLSLRARDFGDSSWVDLLIPHHYVKFISAPTTEKILGFKLK